MFYRVEVKLLLFPVTEFLNLWVAEKVKFGTVWIFIMGFHRERVNPDTAGELRVSEWQAEFSVLRRARRKYVLAIASFSPRV